MKSILTTLVFIAAGMSAIAQEASFIVHSGEYRMKNEPVYMDLDPGMVPQNVPLCLSPANQSSRGESKPGQIEVLEDGTHRLWWIADVPSGSSRVYNLFTDQNCNRGGEFTWSRVSADATRLYFGNRPVIQYEHPVYNPDNIDGTLKPFHQVFDPAGSGIITKGPGGLYSHHRGIYFGYYLYTGDDRLEKSENDEGRIDIWHANNGERSEHSRIIREFSGPVMGGQVLEILWKDHDGNVLVREERDIRVFRQPHGETVIDFFSSLNPVSGPVKLGGDRQHAGVQFRAAQYVADHPEATRFIRPQAIAHLASDSEIGGSEMYDLPWNAMQFTISDRTYTTSYFSHPDNPENAEMSERRYGRFGEYIPHDLRNDNLLNLNYRFRITAGDAPGIRELEKRYGAYASQPVVEIR